MIDEALRSGRSGRSVAADFGLSVAAVGRHARLHLPHRPGHVVLNHDDQDGGRARDPLDELVAALRDRALAGDVAAAREYRLGLAAQQAQRAASVVVDLAMTPEWTELRTVMLAALEGHPEARIAVADALRAAGAL